jgi:hypothetical protein
MTLGSLPSAILDRTIVPSSPNRNVTSYKSAPVVILDKSSAYRRATLDQVLLTIGQLRCVAAVEVPPTDPLIEELSSYNAWVVEHIRERYDKEKFGTVCAASISRFLLESENTGMLGPDVDSFE